jgi:hypothetical protein
MRCTIVGTVSVDDDVRGAVEEGAGTGCPRERVVGAGDHEVVWQVRR